MRILVTGGTGQVGTELRLIDWPQGVEVIAPNRAELDLADQEAVQAYVMAGGFAAVINPAAYTAVDRAESEPLTAFRINALAPAVLAAATREAGIPLLHVSTDYVFDGHKTGAYIESDPVSPVSVYGASKEAGEQAVRSINPRHVILRTAWVFSPHGANFVKTMLRLGATRPELGVVDDQRGCPTPAKAIAEALGVIALRLIADRGAPCGTYHLAGDEETSWHGFAREIFRQAAARGLQTPRLNAITTADYPTPARRPANSVLASAHLAKDYAILPPDWRAGLGQTLDALEIARVEETR